MKRYIITIILITFGMAAFSQNAVDALRYSDLKPSGTARYNSMSGAFSSLGGDFSTISHNPAGLGIYRKSTLTFSPSIMFSRTDSKYLNNKESDFNYNVAVGNLGYVGTFLFKGESNMLKSLSFGVGYNQLKNFNQSIDIKGVNNDGSITDYFAAMADGDTYLTMGSFYEYPAYWTYLIDPTNPEGDQFESSYSAYGEEQAKIIERSGNVGEYVFSMGMNFNHNFYLGASFGIQDVNFEQNIFYSETDINDNIDNFNSFNYTDNLKTNGTGYNFKIGAIFRPIDWMRISAAVHTPTFYNLNDEYETEFVSNFETDSMSITHQSPLGVYDYRLLSPLRALGGVSFMIMDQALISFDYEFANYGISKLSADDYSFDKENDNIAESYTTSHTIKAGAEYRLGFLAFRGGAAYSTSPFESDEINKDADFMQFSGGFGVRLDSFFFDMAYINQISKEKYFMYEGYGYSSAETDLTNSRHSIMATLGFRF